MEFPERNKISNDKYLKTNYIDKKFNQTIDWKPKGLWYSSYDSWYNLILNDIGLTEWLYDYLYKIDINNNNLTTIRDKNKNNKNKLLVIRDTKDFNIFCKKYKNKVKIISLGRSHHIIYINWKKVSHDYGGIEIIPYLNKKRNIDWYYTWDVASGCIWNNELIENITHVGEKDENYKYTSFTPLKI